MYFTKKMILLIFVVSLSSNVFAKSYDDFKYELNYIVNKFLETPYDLNKCKSLTLRANNLIEEIEDFIDDEFLSKPEIYELTSLKKVVESVKNYISVVSPISFRHILIEEFKIANKIIGAETISVYNKKSKCGDVILIKIGRYVAYLIKNETRKVKRIDYKWDSPSGQTQGHGEMGVGKQSYVKLYDNREDPNHNRIIIKMLQCR